MKITKLVLLFNQDKLLLGSGIAIIMLVASKYVGSILSGAMIVFAILILLNIVLSILASYRFYDASDLYKPEKLFKDIPFKKAGNAILLHASFDPISRRLEKVIQPMKLKVYNIYGNRHETEKLIKVSNRAFPPHPNQINVNPTDLTDESNSVDYIFAITAAHEILGHEKRVEFFKEVKRVLKQEGTLILCEQMRNMTNFLFFNIGAFHFVSLKHWEYAIHAAGLKIVKREKLTLWGTVLHIEK